MGVKNGQSVEIGHRCASSNFVRNLLKVINISNTKFKEIVYYCLKYWQLSEKVTTSRSSGHFQLL